MASSHPIALIIGVGPGLGAALCGVFSEAGFTVAGAARRHDEVAKLLPKGGKAYACDVTSEADVAKLFSDVKTDLGIPDFICFNAGAFAPGSILDISPEDFERCWRVGCFGGFLVGQQAARQLLEKGSGTLVFTGATAALRGSARFANLAVPKFGLRALAQSMARELGPRNIHVAHTIIDGIILSDRARDIAPNMTDEQMLVPREIANTYLMLHTQHRSAWSHELDLRPHAESW